MQKLARSLAVALVLLVSSPVLARGHSRTSGLHYGGGHHSSSHGGSYRGGHGSSHKGGHYKSPHGGSSYGKRK